MKTMKTVAAAFCALGINSIMLSGDGVYAADLTVAKGSPYTVTADESYDAVKASDAIILNDGVKFSAKANPNSYTLQADAAADEFGKVDAIRIGAGATFASSYQMNSAHSSTGVIAFAGSNAKIALGVNSWYSTWFASGKWELVDTTGTGMTLSVPGTWSFGSFNSAGVSVRLLGTGDVKVVAGWSQVGQDSMTFNQGFMFANAGKVTLTSEYGGNYSVSGNGVFDSSVTNVVVNRGNYKYEPVKLTIASGKVASVRNLEAYDGGCCSGSGTLRMGEGDSDGTLKANIQGSALTVEKVGSGTLTVSVCTNIPTLTVNGGTVVLKAAMPVGKLSVAEGAAVTVDGVEIVVQEVDRQSQARVSCVNGGKFVIAKGGDGDVYWRDAALTGDDIEFLKVGSGRVILHSDTCADRGVYHLQGGQVLFSKRGLTDKYLRFTFKKVLGWINYSNVLEAPGYLRLKQVALYGADGSRALDAQLTYNSAHNGYAATQLAKGEVSVPSGTTFNTETTAAYYKTPDWLFSSNNGNWPVFATAKLDDAADSSKWQEVLVRLPDGVGTLDGYSFCANYNNGLPTTWMIESSATGEDGSWRVIADETDVYFEGVRANHNAGWLDGFGAKPGTVGEVTNFVGRLAMYFNYAEPGVVSTGGDGATVVLENGSVLDASNISGGLGVSKVVCDCALGGGTLRNVRFMESGMIELVNYSGSANRIVLNVEVEDPVDAENLANWQVLINGVRASLRVKIVDGVLNLASKGLVFLLK